MKTLYYMAHPVAPITDGNTVADNIAAAMRYLAALNRAGLHVIAPWIGLVNALDDANAAERAHGMATDMLALPRCDGIILCGPMLSSGMATELEVAQREGLLVINCIGRGVVAACVWAVRADSRTASEVAEQQETVILTVDDGDPEVMTPEEYALMKLDAVRLDGASSAGLWPDCPRCETSRAVRQGTERDLSAQGYFCNGCRRVVAP